MNIINKEPKNRGNKQTIRETQQGRKERGKEEDVVVDNANKN